MEILWECFPYFLNLFFFYSIVYSIYSLLYLLFYSLENNNNKQSWFFSRYLGFHVNWCVLFISPFNMVSERDNEHTLETLENKKTATSFSVVVASAVNARISAATDKWFLATENVQK